MAQPHPEMDRRLGIILILLDRVERRQRRHLVISQTTLLLTVICNLMVVAKVFGYL